MHRRHWRGDNLWGCRSRCCWAWCHNRSQCLWVGRCCRRLDRQGAGSLTVAGRGYKGGGGCHERVSSFSLECEIVLEHRCSDCFLALECPLALECLAVLMRLLVLERRARRRARGGEERGDGQQDREPHCPPPHHCPPNIPSHRRTCVQPSMIKPRNIVGYFQEPAPSPRER